LRISAAVVVVGAATALAQTPGVSIEWLTYGGNLAVVHLPCDDIAFRAVCLCGR